VKKRRVSVYFSVGMVRVVRGQQRRLYVDVRPSSLGRLARVCVALKEAGYGTCNVYGSGWTFFGS